MVVQKKLTLPLRTDVEEGFPENRSNFYDSRPIPTKFEM